MIFNNGARARNARVFCAQCERAVRACLCAIALSNLPMVYDKLGRSEMAELWLLNTFLY
jgi:hypothetical protein